MSYSSSDSDSAATAADKRRWNAFVCQDCRAIFRVPADYLGNGVVCPACDRMLRIPRAGESVPTLVQESSEPRNEPAQIQEIDDQTEEAITSEILEEEKSIEEIPSETAIEVPAPVSTGSAGGQWKRRKREREVGTDAERQWDAPQSRVLWQFSRQSPMLWWGVAAVLLIAIIGLVIALWPHTPPAPIVQIPTTLTPLDSAEMNQSSRENEALRQLNAMRDGKAAIEKFLQSYSVKTMLPLLRPVDGLEEKVTAHYAKFPINPLKYESIDEINSSRLENQMLISAFVRFNELDVRPINAIKVDGHYRIDWESWVAWSEMDYKTVMTKKPTQPVEVRVTVTMESYYNYDFPNSSENEWQSYRLEFPAENQVLYGYLPRSSALNLSIVSALDLSTMPMTLKIRYRDESSHASQVLIDSIVAQGWVKDLPKP